MAKNRDYDYGFHDDVTPTYSTGKGLTEEIVRKISAYKHEPEWMLEYRLKSLELFYKLPMPDFGPDLSGIDFDDVIYFQKIADKKLMTGMMFLIKSRKLLRDLVSRKQNETIYQVPWHNTNLKLSTII
ncbi:Iron-sulfur cluster assembly protein SufB [Streptococcus sp. HSISB1]|nr:Iron-sulfur cluster assembly protein SufB [Streptococcus sp. HSISB1]